MSSVAAPATPRSGPRVTSSHQPAVDSLEAGRMTRSAGTPDFSTEPHGRSTRNTWNGSPQRELTTNTLSGKLGADHVDQATGANLFSDVVLLKVDRFG